MLSLWTHYNVPLVSDKLLLDTTKWKGHTRGAKRLKDRFLGYSGCVSSAHHCNYRDTSKGALHVIHGGSAGGAARQDPISCACAVPLCRLHQSLCAVCLVPWSLCAGFLGPCVLCAGFLCSPCVPCAGFQRASPTVWLRNPPPPVSQSDPTTSTRNFKPCDLCESLWPLWILVNLVWEWCKDLGFLASPTSVSAYIKLVKGSPSDRVNYLNVHSLDGFFYRFLCLSVYISKWMKNIYPI